MVSSRLPDLQAARLPECLFQRHGPAAKIAGKIERRYAVHSSKEEWCSPGGHDEGAGSSGETLQEKTVPELATFFSCRCRRELFERSE